MKSLTPYLIFNGNAREAMQFYADVLHADLRVSSGGDMPNCSEANKDKVLHASLSSGAVNLMASDDMSNNPFQIGNNVWLTIDCSTAEEQTRLFDALSASGSVSMPLQDTFWGAHFGMLTDRFGVHWMFNLDKGPQA